MTRVTELSVRDFKAVDEAEVHPGGVNLIVGRNNVGKTSLLEALHLALDPRSISRFDGNQDKVVREGAEEAAVGVELFRDDGVEDQSVTITRRSNEAIYDILRADVGRKIQSAADELEADTSEIVAEASNHVSDMIEYGTTDRKPERNLAFLEIREDVIYASEVYWRLIHNVSSGALSESLPGDFIPFSNSLAFTRDGGFRDEIETTEVHTRFVTDPKITDSAPDPNTDGAAIRRSRIEDFLIDNDIVDGLVDFSFGRLVFEEGDEREEVPYDFIGSGFKTLVGILWELYDQDADTEVMLIEEPAVHMHPGYVNEFTQQLLQVAREEDVQLFLTTHREDLIESFFAPPTEREHGDYLGEEFRVIQMTDLLAKELDYEQAEAELEELNTDLRGI